jgi:threonine dehydrogenase-like Zn-dependent dehydrogenase
MKNSNPFENKDRFKLKESETGMKAVVTLANGGYEMLSYQDVAIPKLDADEVLIQVLAAGVNNTEINTRLGWYSSKVTEGTDALGQNLPARENCGSPKGVQ